MSTGLGSREKILHHARDLFYFVGYQTTSVDDILRVSGVAKSNFYYHFKTKDELALAVLELQIADFRDRALTALARQDRNPAQRMDDFFAALIQTQADIQRLGGCPFGNFAAALSSAENDERAQRFRQELCRVFHLVQEALTVCLEDGVRSGVFRADIPPDQLALMALAVIEGLMLMTKTRRSTMPLTNGLPVLQRMLRVD